MNGAQTAVRVQDLSVRYGDRIAVHRVSLTVRLGEVLAVVGPNGSGKSSLLRVVAGLQASAEGTVSLADGRSVAELRAAERARSVAWMPQEEPPGENISAREYVAFGRYAHLNRWAGPSASDRARVAEALRAVDLAEAADRGVRELSGGERQRVRLARVLAQEAPVVLLDEPTAQLDVGHQLDVLERVRRWAREEGRGVVLAVHDLNLAARYADRLAVLSHGRLVAEGRAREVLSAELLERVWGIVAEVRRDPSTGLPYLLPRLASASVSSAPVLRSRARVHVVAGGGSGGELLRRLVEEGYDVSTGVLPLFDSDVATAQELGVPIAAELPFAPIGPEALERCEGLVRAASALVVAAFPVGPTNLANLEAVERWAPGRLVALLRQPDAAGWDFTGGAATRLRERLLRTGAVEVPDLEGLTATLEERLRGPPVPGARRSDPDGQQLEVGSAGGIQLGHEPRGVTVEDDHR